MGKPVRMCLWEVPVPQRDTLICGGGEVAVKQRGVDLREGIQHTELREIQGQVDYERSGEGHRKTWKKGF